MKNMNIRMNRQKINNYALGMTALSTIPMILGIAFLIVSYNFKSKSIATTGKIIELIVENGSGTNDLYRPVFTYKDQSDKEHKITSNTSSYPAVGEVGDQVEVLYIPSNPNSAKINRFFNIWGLPTVLLLLAGGYFFISFTVYIVTKKAIRNQTV